jgi:serine/threonine-protein kinase
VKVCSTCSESYANDVATCPLDDTPLKKSADPFLGRTIAARYRLIRRLGIGGMASVYLARHVMIDRLSAIKILRQDFSLDPTHRERFLREARAVNRIHHRNIVEITDCGEMDGVAYLVMEYVDGRTLFQELLGGPFPWSRAARIGLQVASALGRAHQMGVVHRDLKPENILLVRAGSERTASPPLPHSADGDHVKLTDFGIAKIVDAPALTFSESLFGTPGYIAPECIEGLPIDGRTDLYSLGVVLYEMLTGRLPYDARGAELLTAPLVSSPIPLSARVSGIPSRLESLVLTMLSRSKDHRPTDAFAVHDALSSLVKAPDDLGLAGPSPSAQPRVDASPTIVEISPSRFPPSRPASLSPGTMASSQETEAPTSSRFFFRRQSDLAELEASIERARRTAAPRDEARVARAEGLAGDAKQHLIAIERVSLLSTQQQATVDELDARGRDFRATLGHAIDELVRQRTRERLHAAALGALSDVVQERMRGEKRIAEALVWESAALSAESEQAKLQDADISHQIATLQARLEEANADLEAELAEAAGALEGSLAGLRQLTAEFTRALEEAETLLRSLAAGLPTSP